MTDENNTQNTEQEIGSQWYIDKINDLKKNTVDVQKYNKALEDNKRLADALTNNRQVETAEEKPVVDEAQLKKDFFAGNKFYTDYDRIKTSLQLRQIAIDKGEQDPYVSNSKETTSEDFETMHDLAETLQELVDKSEGDPVAFRNNLRRISF